MARSRPHPCNLPGCGILTKTSHCEKHTKQKKKDHHKRVDRKRKSAAKRGYDRTWRAHAKQFLYENPLCVTCEKEGVIKLATVVDHIIPHKGDRILFWDKENWQSQCKPHHDAKTRSGL